MKATYVTVPLLFSIALHSSNTFAVDAAIIALTQTENNAGHQTSDDNAKLSLKQSRRLDDKRPDDQYKILLFGKPLTIGGEYGIRPTYRKDFSLGKEADDRLKLDQKLEVELLYEWSDQVAFFVEGKFRHNIDRRIGENRKDRYTSLERGEIWAYINHVYNSPWSLKIGRQSIQDKREWWWGGDMDAVLTRYKQGNIKVDIALAQELGSISTQENMDPEKKDIFRVLAHASWTWTNKQRLELFALYQNDRSDSPQENDILDQDKEDDFDANLYWIGARAIGRVKVREFNSLAHYWLDLGYVSGREREFDFNDIDENRSQIDNIFQRDVRGWGMDIGVTTETKLSGNPSFTFSYAFGSGDGDPNDGIDNSFRQTGLQNNNGKFRGVDRFRYYGELLRPELSNLHILTLSAGFPLLSNSSVEFLFHKYRQDKAAPLLRNSRLRIRPEGDNTDIGTEIDIIIGIEERKNLEIELVGSVFIAGDAFGKRSGQRAYTTILKIDYNF